MTTQKFLFRFGYCTPAQWAGNDAHGWDDESSGAFFVEADSREAALSWGRRVANEYVARLFEAVGQKPPTSWVDAQFANWIEEDPEGAFSEESRKALPTVRFGESPDFGNWA